MMTRSMLKKYASENSLPFSQVLGWYVTGIVLHLIEKSRFSDNLIIVHPYSLDANQDLHILEEGIKAVYIPDDGISANEGFVPGCPYTDDFRERLIFKIQEMASLEKLPLVIRIPSKMAKPEFYYEDMYVPVNLEISEGSDEYRQLMSLSFSDPEITEINVFMYPAEKMAAGYIAQIMDRLELISEMEIYLYLYELLTHVTMSGRDICENIRQMHEEAWRPSQKKLDILLSFGHNTYMKKKWKVLLRRHKLRTPSWEEVIQLLQVFLEPIYNSLTTDIIFFADWMPDLGRYLD